MKTSSKNLALWLAVGLLIFATVHLLQNSETKPKSISFSEFIAAVENGKVQDVIIQGEEYKGKFKEDYHEGAHFLTVGPTESEKTLALLKQSETKYEFKKLEDAPLWQQIVFSWLPIIVLVLFFFFIMKQIQIGGGKALSFGKSKAKMLMDNQRKVTFKDVAGADEAKEELEEIIEFLKNPEKFTKLGGRIPKGVLLMGPPGTGKTLLARAVAGEAGVPFFSISGSDFVEMFVGVGASRVRDLFEQGKKNAPCIIFIDEIDAVGRHRGAGLGGGHDEREQTLNQLLVEMDGFESSEGVILVAATNRPDVLDPALLRPGRFDRRVMVSNPDVKGREEILKIHSRRVPMSEDVNLAHIARGTPGFSGADLENIVNEAALYAARRNKKNVSMSDFEQAKDKVIMGSERRSMVITLDEKKTTAYHEAGHTLVALNIEEADPVHKVTIIPRGRALGLTQQLPEKDMYSQSKDYAEAQISILMGGRIAEEIVLNQKTTGAGNDFERASELARHMVCDWGMSDKLGPLTFGQHDEQPFLGRNISKSKNYSESTAVLIDEEVKDIVVRNYNRARKILEDKIDILHSLANSLLERETLNQDEILKVVQGETLDPIKEEKDLSDEMSAEKKEKSTDHEIKGSRINSIPVTS